jgi:phosphate:Na+ symporter
VSVPAAAAAFLGGIGMFLLGMGLMTEGLKLAAGSALERVLASSTRTRLRGLGSGALLTALVQSSSAVTVATIGFVNAGLVSLGQALWVLYGANVGTTMTGWLVALVGLQFKVEVFALPLVGVGMLLRLTGEKSRRGAVGLALAGFGVLFLGIEVLRSSFAAVAQQVDLPQGEGAFAVLAQLAVGVVMTVLMQSSSAALAVALTAAQGGMLSPQGAAAVVIGANIGTTVTALLATIGATPNAKRAAAGHVAFNVLTGVVALALLPWLVTAIAGLRQALALPPSPAAKLALFHTAFNLLGVVLMWPLSDRLAHELGRRFRSGEEDEARPQHLDDNVLAVPALALDALEQEVRRFGGMAVEAARRALTGEAAPPQDPRPSARLGNAIAEFITRLNRQSMGPESARRLPEILRVVRYWEAVRELAADAAAVRAEPGAAGALARFDAAFRQSALALLEAVDPRRAGGDAEEVARLAEEMQRHYQELKAAYLEAGAAGSLALPAMDAALRHASTTRRALEQAIKGRLHLQRVTR